MNGRCLVGVCKAGHTHDNPTLLMFCCPKIWPSSHMQVIVVAIVLPLLGQESHGLTPFPLCKQTTRQCGRNFLLESAAFFLHGLLRTRSSFRVATLPLNNKPRLPRHGCIRRDRVGKLMTNNVHMARSVTVSNHNSLSRIHGLYHNSKESGRFGDGSGNRRRRHRDERSYRRR